MKHCPLKIPEGLPDPDRSITILFDGEEDLLVFLSHFTFPIELLNMMLI